MLLYKNGSTFEYAASMAATWVWAPAFYVTSFIGYNQGLFSLIIFLIPNFLGVFLFGIFAKHAIYSQNKQGLTFNDIIARSCISQERLHTVLGVVLLTCSSIVQLIGMHLLLTHWFSVDKLTSAFLISAVSLLIVWKNGIKASIVSDVYKYLLVLIAGIILLGVTLFDPSNNFSQITFFKEQETTSILNFAITGGLGLITAPYVDQTFWQRAYSMKKENLVKTFAITACIFIVIPAMFGTIGLLCATQGHGADWIISNYFDGWLGVLFGLAVFCALLSTLDSNLCAMQCLQTDLLKTEKYNKASYFILLAVSCLFFISFNMTINDYWLIYGTARSTAFVPMLLVLLNRFDARRLFIGTLLAVVVGAGGYVMLKHWDHVYLMSILACLLPLIGYKPKQA